MHRAAERIRIVVAFEELPPSSHALVTVRIDPGTKDDRQSAERGTEQGRSRRRR